MTRRELALTLGVGLLALVPYLPTAHFGATYDDHAHLLNNAFVHHPENARFLWSPRYFALELPDQARPVLLATLLLDRALFGEWLGGYHLTSALWHALAAALAFGLARRLRYRAIPAAAGAALFAVHPACTEAVAAISNREDPLAAVWVLVSLLTARRFLAGPWRRGAADDETGGVAPPSLLRSAPWCAISALSFALALGAKEVALVAPGLFAALSWASPDGWRPRDRPRLRWLALGASAAVVLALFALFQARLGAPSLSIGAGGGPLSPAGAGALVWLSPRAAQHAAEWAHALPIEVYRLGRVVLGWPLSAEHDVAFSTSPAAIALAAVALLALLGLTAQLARRDRRAALPLMWALLATAPVMPSPWLLNAAADRYLYLPALGVWVVLGACVASARPSRYWGIVLTALLAVFLTRSADRVWVWRDDVTLFRDAAQHAPRSARVWQNLGAAHLDRGETSEARAALERAIELEPALLAAHLNLGIVHLRRGEDERALEALADAVLVPPIAGEVHLHERAFVLQARTLARLGRHEELARAVQRELERSGESGPARAWRE